MSCPQPPRPSLHRHAFSDLLIHHFHSNPNPNTPFKMPSPSTSLTSHLLSLSPSAFKSAAQSPFLERAGKGTLKKEVLQKWLSQDRLYAQAYIRFASLLLANMPLPEKVESGHVNEQYIPLPSPSLIPPLSHGIDFPQFFSFPFGGLC
jgi:hypothetical protein